MLLEIDPNLAYYILQQQSCHLSSVVPQNQPTVVHYAMQLQVGGTMSSQVSSQIGASHVAPVPSLPSLPQIPQVTSLPVP